MTRVWFTWRVGFIALAFVAASCAAAPGTTRPGSSLSTAPGSSLASPTAHNCGHPSKHAPSNGPTSSDTAVQWVADVGSGPAPSPTLVAVDDDGDIYVVSDVSGGKGTTDLLLQRLNADGAVRWSTTIPTKASGVLTPAMVVRNGTTSIAWSSFDASRTEPAEYGIGLTTVGSDGEVVNSVTIPHQHAVLLLDLSASGNVIVAFDRDADKRATIESWAPDGSLAWRAAVADYGFTPDYSGFVRTTTIDATDDGGVVVAGVIGEVEQSTNAEVRLLDIAGETQWTTKIKPFDEPISHVSVHALPGSIAVGVGDPYGANEGASLTYLNCDGSVTAESALMWVNRIDKLVGTGNRQTALGLHVWGEGFDSHLLPVRAGSATGQDQLRRIGGAVAEIRGYPNNFINDVAATPDGGLVMVGSIKTSGPLVPTTANTPRTIAIKLTAPAGTGSLSGIPDLFGLDEPATTGTTPGG